MMRRLIPANDLAGQRVRNPAGEVLGKVSNLIIDPGQGNVAYAVLTVAGESPAPSVAVPMKVLRVARDSGELILDISPDRLRRAPRFDPQRWPDMANARWALEVHRHYGVSPYWE